MTDIKAMKEMGLTYQELADILAFTFLLAEKYEFNVKQIVLDKIKLNGEKYPVDKAKGTAKKYDEL